MSDSFSGYGLPKGSDFIGGVGEGSLEPCASGLTPYCDIWADPILDHGMQPTLVRDDSHVVVHIGGFRGYFLRNTLPDGPYVNGYGTPETLTGGGSISPGIYILTLSDGTVVEFFNLGVDLNADAKFAMPSRMIKPDGEIITYSYTRTQIPTNLYDPTIPGGPPEYYEKLTGVTATSSLGWQVTGELLDASSNFNMYNTARSSSAQIGYGAWSLGYTNLTRQTQSLSGGQNTVRERLTRGMSDNGVNGYVSIYQDHEERTKYTCQGSSTYDPDSQSWSVAGDCQLWWQEGFNYSMKEVTAGNRMILATYVAPPNDFNYYNVPQIAAGCIDGGFVPGSACIKYIDRGGQRWTYDYVTQNGVNGIRRTDPLGHTRFIAAGHDDIVGTLPTVVTDELNRTTTFQYSVAGKIAKISYPEGNHTDYEYDSRQNLTKVSVYPKDNGPPIVTQYGYDATCDNMKTCNKPNWSKDAKGNQTNYTYDATHGGITSMTLPADNAGIRPQMRYYYKQLYPKDINNNVVNMPVWRLIKTLTCRSSTNSCAGTADEMVTEYGYDDRNLMQTSVTVHAGDNSISTTTSYVYDFAGNRVMVDGPRTDVDDRSYAVYDNGRHLIYEIGVDPDSAGPLKRVVVHHVFDNDFNEIRTEIGTGSTITFDSNGFPTGVSDFAITSLKRMTFDDVGRLSKTEVVLP